MTPLVFCRFQPPQLLQPSQHICPAGRQQMLVWKFRYPITLRKCLKCNAKIYIIFLPGWFYDIEVRNARPAECD